MQERLQPESQKADAQPCAAIPAIALWVAIAAPRGRVAELTSPGGFDRHIKAQPRKTNRIMYNNENLTKLKKPDALAPQVMTAYWAFNKPAQRSGDLK